jgi:hypothetical protein
MMTPQIVSKLRSCWGNYHKIILRITVVLMAFAALVWLGYEFYRLLWQPAQICFYKVHPGAIDLKIFHSKVQQWAAGKPLHGSVYPPATYVILWPLLGWLEIGPAIWFWAATSIAGLWWLVWLIIRESGAKTTLERIFVGLIPLCMYAAGATIGNGQLIVHLLPLLVVGLLLVSKGQNNLRRDLAASILILLSLAKPTVTAPFFWIAIFVPGRLRPALMVVIGYIVLTLVAVSFPPSNAIVSGNQSSALLSGFIKTGSGAAVKAGEANLHIWMGALGLKKWALHASLLVLAVSGLWVYQHRHADLWLLMGVTAIVARFWTYHRWYDDLLILLPMVALFRIAKQGSISDSRDVVSGLLLGITLLMMIAPGGLYLLAPPWNMIYVNFQVAVWTMVFIFLVQRARTAKDGKVS